MLKRVALYLSRNRKVVLSLIILIMLVSISMGLGIGLSAYTGMLAEKQNLEGLEKITIENLQRIASYILWIIVIATLVILSLVFLFWIRKRKNEVGVLLSIGISKKSILAQILIEIVIISMISISLSIAPADMLTGFISKESVSKVSEDTKYGMEANRKGYAQQSVSIEEYEGLSKRDIASIYAATMSVVALSSVGALSTFISKKPCKILLENS